VLTGITSLRKAVTRNIWIWAVVGSLLLWMVISLISRDFSVNVIIMNATLASFLVLLSLGQMTVITSGNGAIDLSSQYTVALAAYVSSILIRSNGIFFGLTVTLAICVLLGVAIGVVNLYLKVPPMITTLAVGFIVYSVVLLISVTTTGMPSQGMAYFTQSMRILSLSPMIFIAALAALLMGVLMYKTPYGKHLHAVGQNRVAAQLAGVKVTRTVILAFVISSVLAGVTGTLLGGYFGGASQDMGVAYLMTSVAATVIGGTSAAGGKSSVAGAVAGAMMLTLIVAFLNLTRLPISTQRIIQGLLLMIVLIASVPKGKRPAGG
jgi:ribose transport system permease protein